VDHPVFHHPFDLSTLTPEALLKVAVDAFRASGVLETLQVQRQLRGCLACHPLTLPRFPLAAR